MSNHDFSGSLLARLCDPDSDKTFTRQIFPISILQSTLYPTNSDRLSMINYFDNIIQHIPNPSVSTGKGNYTGDVNGQGSIHSDSCFNWLLRIVEQKVLEYIGEFSPDISNICFYHQKSWPVILQDGQSVSRHSHDNAQLSAVYYLNIPTPSEGGNIVFYNPSESILPTFGGGSKLLKKQHHAFGFQPVTDMLIIFPSALDHEVSKYQSSMPRYSVTFDIAITASIYAGSGQIENIPPNISLWQPFST
tara:strand:+ start:951 stop:1694 length:744 start_codon:yes stop_codon:yes gene_type:complete